MSHQRGIQDSSHRNVKADGAASAGARDPGPHLAPQVQVHVVASPSVCWDLRGLMQAADTRVVLMGCSDHLDEALPLLERNPPDVVVLDLDDGYGVDDVTRLHDATHLKVLALSSRAEAGFLGAVLDASVRGFLHKREAPSLLLKGIAAVGAGEVFVSPSGTERLIVAAAQQAANHAARAPHPDDYRIARLTARELQTLAAVGSNIAQPVKVIAANLCISEPALRDQLHSIYSKLGVFGRLGLYPYAAPRAPPPPDA